MEDFTLEECHLWNESPQCKGGWLTLKVLGEKRSQGREGRDLLPLPCHSSDKLSQFLTTQKTVQKAHPAEEEAGWILLE